jgi:hypothetical protein
MLDEHQKLELYQTEGQWLALAPAESSINAQGVS